MTHHMIRPGRSRVGAVHTADALPVLNLSGALHSSSVIPRSGSLPSRAAPGAVLTRAKKCGNSPYFRGLRQAVDGEAWEGGPVHDAEDGRLLLHMISKTMTRRSKDGSFHLPVSTASERQSQICGCFRCPKLASRPLLYNSEVANAEGRRSLSCSAMRAMMMMEMGMRLMLLTSKEQRLWKARLHWCRRRHKRYH